MYIIQDQRIRVSKDHTVLESDFDEVLGQEATQDQVFASAQGRSPEGCAVYGASPVTYSCCRPRLADLQSCFDVDGVLLAPDLSL